MTSTLSSFSQILIHSRFKNYPTRTDIIGLASPWQLKSLNRDVKKSPHNTRNIWTDPRATSASESRFPEGATNFPATRIFYICCKFQPTIQSQSATLLLLQFFLTRSTWQENSRQFCQAQKDLEKKHY